MSENVNTKRCLWTGSCAGRFNVTYGPPVLQSDQQSDPSETECGAEKPAALYVL